MPEQVLKIYLPTIKNCLKRDNKASRAETTDDTPNEGIFQLALFVGGINLQSDIENGNG